MGFLQLTLSLGEMQLGPGNLEGIFWNFLHLMFVIAGFLYVIFSIIIIRQIYTMQRSLVTSFSKVLRSLSYLHLALAVIILLYFIFGL